MGARSAVRRVLVSPLLQNVTKCREKLLLDSRQNISNLLLRQSFRCFGISNPETAWPLLSLRGRQSAVRRSTTVAISPSVSFHCCGSLLPEPPLYALSSAPPPPCTRPPNPV